MKPSVPTPPAVSEELPNSPIVSAARALPAGTRLDDFELGEIIGEGSATIVYAATDHALAVPVVIAEYMPASIAQRNDAAQVTPRSPAQADAFARGLKAFINETRTLARCDHPSLVRIVRLFEANATFYRVMPRYPTRRLLEVRQHMLEPPDEQAVRALLDALLGALEVFHRTGGFHGKVTPSNILLLPGNRPLLLSPGAAGRAIADDRIDALITTPEPSFAPVEQIVEPMDTPLHPSVDLYALAGVARYWISGQLPEPVFAPHDTAHREPFAEMAQRLCLTWPRLHYSASLVGALETALSIYPAERPQSVAQMRARLGTAPPVAGDVVGPSIADPASNDAVPSSPEPPAPATQEPPAPATQDLDAVMAVAPGPDPEPESESEPGSIPEPESIPEPGPEPEPELRSGPEPEPELRSGPEPEPELRSGPEPEPELRSGPELEPELLATDTFTRIDDDSSARTAFTRQAANSRRAAAWSGTVVLLALLLLAGVYEFRQEHQFARVLDVLGISRGTGAEDSAAVSASGVGPAAPATTPIAADPGAAKSMPPEPAADSPANATAPAAPATATAPASPANATAPASPVSATAPASPANATAPASPASATASAPAASATAPAPPASATAPASPAAANPATPATADTVGPAEPAAPAQPSAQSPPPARTAQQGAPRAAASPRAACGARTEFALYRCMQTQCSQRRWASHPQCKRLRSNDNLN